MKIARRFLFFFAISALLPGELLSMRSSSNPSNKKLKDVMQLLNVQGGACNDFDKIKKIMRLIKIEYSALESVLSKNPESKKVFSRSLRNIITNMHPNCVKSETQRCSECRILLESTIKNLTPFLKPLLNPHKKSMSVLPVVVVNNQLQEGSCRKIFIEVGVVVGTLLILAIVYEGLELFDIISSSEPT